MKRLLLLHVLLLHVSCLTLDEMSAFTPRLPNYTDINTGLKAIINVTDNGDGSQTLYTNGIPSHATWQFPNPLSQPSSQTEEFEVVEVITVMKIFSEPIMRQWDNPIRCLPLGMLGVATSGVSIHGWFPAQEECPEVLDTEIEMLDICEGHPSPSGQYHYHGYSPCVQMPTCGKPSTIWGVMIDGIPLYGPWDEDGTQLTKADLDECGGKNDSSGRYKYHVTVDPHYTVSCLRGEIHNDVGMVPSDFFCSCPFEDTAFQFGRDPKYQGDKMVCEFGSNESEPAVCQDNIDTSYDIGYTWEYQDKETALAPCCPNGTDCGDSCKTDDGIKDICTQETRTIKFLTRVKNEMKNEGDNEVDNEVDNESMIGKAVSVYCVLMMLVLQMCLP